MSHGSDLSAPSHATSAPMGPKNKECTSQVGTMETVSPWGSFPIIFSQSSGLASHQQAPFSAKHFFSIM